VKVGGNMIEREAKETISEIAEAFKVY